MEEIGERGKRNTSVDMGVEMEMNIRIRANRLNAIKSPILY